MGSLYARLFRYRARPGREPLEDFLSEALCDILGRMPVGQVIAFLRWCFREAPHQPAWSALENGRIEWVTQLPVPGGIADIVLRVGGKPVLVVENKTWSGFRDHGTEGDAANQLTTYCRWLSDNAAGQSECAVLLVTATTASPPGFHGDGDGDYAVASRAQVTWASVGRWLRAEIQGVDAGATWRDLAADLVAFLKEMDLASEIYTGSDVAALNMLLPTMDRWESTFDAIWSAAPEISGRFLNKQVSKLQFRSEAGMLWNWRYGQSGITPNKSYLGLGLRFPEISRWYEKVPLPSSPHFVFIVASDVGVLGPSRAAAPNWLYDEEDGNFLRSLVIHELALAPDRRVDQLRAWSREAMAEAEEILGRARLM